MTCNHCDYRHHPKQFHSEFYVEICLTKLVKDGKTHKFDKPSVEKAGNITKIPDLLAEMDSYILNKKSMKSLDVMSSCYLITEVWEIFGKQI